MATRRMFLKRAAGTAVVLGCPAILGGCGGGGPEGGLVDAGNIADYAPGDLVALVGEGVALGYDDQGLYAVSTFCTHSNCDMSQQGTIDGQSGFSCSCHGSTFDPNGKVTGGPATTDLQHYAVTLDDAGDIAIDLDQTVSADTRTPVA